MITMSQTESGTRKKPIYIKDAIETLFEKGQVVEIRSLYNNNRCPTKNGFYDDFEALVKVADKMDTEPDVKGIYVVLNSINPDLLARKNNRVDCAKDSTGTGDTNIIKRRWLPIDIDPERLSGISSSDEEHELSLEKASRIADWLAEMGFPEPIKADSSNGAHLLYRIDLDNTDENTSLIRKCIEAIALFYTDEESKVDTTVYNASRIWKLYGTVSRKGDSIPARPHRRSKIISKPAEIKIVDVYLLEKLADIVPTDEDTVDSTVPYSRYDTGYYQKYPTVELGKWLEEHNIEARHKKWVEDSDIYILRKCPFSDAHVDGAYAIQFKNGKIIACCHHESCGGRKNRWKELLSKYEPDQSMKPKSRVEQQSYRVKQESKFNISKVSPVKANHLVSSGNRNSMIEKDLIRLNILRCVNLLQNPPFGRQQIKNILQGRKLKKINQYGHQDLFVYGSLENVSDEMILDSIEKLIQEGYLINSGGFHPTLRITEEGEQFLDKLNKLDDTQSDVQYYEEEMAETLKPVPSLESLLLKLESLSASERVKAIQDISLIGDEKCILPLICMLDDKEENVRAAAVNCLGCFKDPELFNPIYKMINDQAVMVRFNAVVALGKMGTSAALRGLIHCLENRDNYVRRDAVYVLGEIGYYDAVKPLLFVLKRDKDPQVQEEALISLGKVGDPSTLEVIKNELQRKSLVNKEAACLAIGYFGDIDSTLTLAEYTKHPDERVRKAAIEGLGLMRNPDAIEFVIPALKDIDDYVRLAAVVALGRIGSIKGIPALIGALDDSDSLIRKRAIDFLGQMRYMQPLSHLEKLLGDTDPEIRNGARDAIHNIISARVNFDD